MDKMKIKTKGGILRMLHQNETNSFFDLHFFK